MDLAKRDAIPDKDGMRLGAIILAGGRSRRMGRAKESLALGDETLLGHVCATLGACASPVLVVARDRQQELPALPSTVDVLHDAVPESGPLAALVVGLRRLRSAHAWLDVDAAFVTGCDLPFLSAALVIWLANQLGDSSVLMPRTEGRLQPMAAICRLSVLPFAEALLASGIRTPRSLAEAPLAQILDETRLRTVDPDLRQLTNVNTPDDYERAVARRLRDRADS